MTSRKSTSPPPSGPPTTAFFSKTFEEAQALSVEALAYAEATHDHALTPMDLSLKGNIESLRLTTRLAQIMAWLMLQRAVHAGELTAEQAAAPEHRLGGGTICYDRRGETMTGLPETLRDLLLRSRKLYQRIARLDEMTVCDAG